MNRKDERGGGGQKRGRLLCPFICNNLCCSWPGDFQTRWTEYELWIICQGRRQGAGAEEPRTESPFFHSEMVLSRPWEQEWETSARLAREAPAACADPQQRLLGSDTSPADIKIIRKIFSAMASNGDTVTLAAASNQTIVIYQCRDELTAPTRWKFPPQLPGTPARGLDGFLNIHRIPQNGKNSTCGMVAAAALAKC